MPVTHIIDLSHWNTVKDFNATVSAGVVGVIHKSTEGTSYVDPDYAPRMTSAINAGLLWGAYHFLKHGKIVEQMKHFLKIAQLPSGSRVCIDYEDAACVLADLQEAVAVLADLDPTMQIAIYSGHLIKDQLGSKHDPILAKTSLWLAQYTSGKPSWPTGTWKAWSLWQFTDQGTCPGITGNVDSNEFNGTRQNCAMWMGPVTEPAPEPEPPEVMAQTVSINVEPGTRVIVNGIEVIAT